jgi:predicted acetyltransferase
VTPQVEVALAAPHEQAVLERLLQLYIHDFSEILPAGDPQGDLGPDGRFPRYPLEDFWRDEALVPLLIRIDGRLAGFALLDRTSHSGRPVERNMREFFIVRKHRRRGAGVRAAQAIFSRWPGQWEAAVMRANAAALPFWRRAAATHPQAEALEEIDARPPDWDGPILRFRIRPA